jgi:hypothetical protein
MNGERAAGAVERYRTNRPWATPCPITPTFDIQTSQRIVTQSVTGCANTDRPAPGAASGAAPLGTGVGIGLR